MPQLDTLSLSYDNLDNLELDTLETLESLDSIIQNVDQMSPSIKGMISWSQKKYKNASQRFI